jgi:hypothetical protein
MTTWPHQDRVSMSRFYGNPDANGDGVPDRAWEDANLVAIKPPYEMVLAWAPLTVVKTIRVHRKAAESLSRILAAILAHYGTQEAIEDARMHLYGGCYMFRLMRGGSQLSIHSWGGAIDLDPAFNSFGKPYDASKMMMPHPVIDAFAAEGWVWGGRWGKPDAMHFQAATI